MSNGLKRDLELTAITQIIEVYTFGGLIFGFNTLIYIFKKEGIYAHLCDQAISEGRAKTGVQTR